MALNLTPEILEKVYELLRVTAPFKRWKLPHADEVEFRVKDLGQNMAWYHYEDDIQKMLVKPTHRIELCVMDHRELKLTVESMAHEMVHMRQRLHEDVKTGKRSAPHGKVFKRLAAQVCRAHRLDPAKF